MAVEEDGADIVRLEPGSGQMHNLTDDPAGNYEGPAWRPDSHDIYALRKGELSNFNDDQVVVLGEGEATVSLLEGDLRRDIAFSPDGDSLFSTLQEGSDLTITELDLQDGDEETVVQDGRALAVSPDGVYIAWRDPNFVRVRGKDGGDVLTPVAADRVFSHSWAPDSRRLAVTLDEDVQRGALAVTTIAGPPSIIAHYPPLYVNDATWSPK